MKQSKEFGTALLIALISVGVMVGILSISLMEFSPESAPASQTATLSSPVIIFTANTLPVVLTATPVLASTTPSPAASPTPTPVVSCVPPSGWLQITSQNGDTLESIAVRYLTSAEAIRSGNCLPDSSLTAGTTLYVPPRPVDTTANCVPGASGWIKTYIVKPGDTLYRIAYNHYISVNQLMSVNCRINSNIVPGEVLWIPNVATRTPYPVNLASPTIALNFTELPLTATTMPLETALPTAEIPIPTSAETTP